MKVDLRKIAFAIIILFGLSQAVRVYGMPERSIAVFEEVSYVVFIVILFVVILQVYRFAVVRLLDWLDESIDDGTKSGLYPLLSVMGTLVISVACVWTILSHMGIDILVILTSAGIIGLAITFGAQNTLSQFFSGLSILLSRPFKVGDVVRLNNTHITYRVRKIGLMNTILEEWDSREPYSFPNNQLSNAIVDNVTSEKKSFNIILFFDVNYESDLAKAKEIMLNAAETAPHIVMDGSWPHPSVSFADMSTTNIRMKLSVFGDDYVNNSPIISGLIENIVNGFKNNGIRFSPVRYDINMCGGAEE